jgi:hypothetical protein
MQLSNSLSASPLTMHTRFFQFFCSLFLCICSCKENIEPSLIKIKTISDITISQAVFTGEIVKIGDAQITAYGVVFDTIRHVGMNSRFRLNNSGSPTTAGEFSIKASHLIPDKTYYIKAFITDKHKTYLSDEVSFKTLGFTIKDFSPKAGVADGRISIRGSNFSPELGENVVYFIGDQPNDAVKAYIEKATDSVLTVISPRQQAGRALRIAVTIHGSTVHSQEKYQCLSSSAFSPHYGRAGDLINVLIYDYLKTNAIITIGGKVAEQIGTANYGADIRQYTCRVPQGLPPGTVKLEVSTEDKLPALPSTDNDFLVYE